MKTSRVLHSYRKKLKRVMAPPLKALEGAKLLNVRMIKVCFGPCRCFTAAKR